jgi:hypothetical protein
LRPLRHCDREACWLHGGAGGLRSRE